MATIKTIWTSDYNTQDYIAEFCEEQELTQEEYKEFEDVYKKELEEFAFAQNELALEDDYTNVSFHEDTNGAKFYVVKAYIETWHGKHEGGRVLEGMENVILACIEDFTNIYMEGRKMKIKASHHDGTNYFEIKELTSEGEKFYERNKDDMSQHELVEVLFNDSHKSRNVTIWRDMYGM